MLSAPAAGPLRVCMVHYSDFYLDSRIQRQARALAERGDQVDLVCLSAPGEVRLGAGRIRLHPVHSPKGGGGARAYLRGYGAFCAGALRRVSALDLRRRFDLVEVHNMPDFLTLSALVPRLRGAPVILNVHDTFPELFATKFGFPPSHPAVRMIEREERWSARLARGVVTVTEEAREHLNARGVGVGKTSVVMNSPDERVFGPRRPAVTVPNSGPVRVLYHGGTAPRFGVEVLIRAIALLTDAPRVALRICGTGEDRKRLARLAEEVAPGRVEVAAPVPFERIPEELATAHVGVVPTLHDGFTELLLPVKLLEYVHMGLPVVASRLPVIERHLGQDALRFVAPGSVRELSEALREVIARPAAARARAERASRRLGQFEWPQQRLRYLELVDDLTRKPRGAAGVAVWRRARPHTTW